MPFAPNRMSGNCTAPSTPGWPMASRPRWSSTTAKHQVIRQAVLAEQDRVDMVALGQAKRKLQQLVEDGRQRKRQSTRTRIARWDTAGKPTRQAALPAATATAEPSPTAAPASPPTVSATTALALPASPEADWELCFVPRQPPDTPTTAAGAGATR